MLLEKISFKKVSNEKTAKKKTQLIIVFLV